MGYSERRPNKSQPRCGSGWSYSNHWPGRDFSGFKGWGPGHILQQTGFTTPPQAEALALRKAIFLYRDLHFHRVVFEGDCQRVILEANCSKVVGNDLHRILWDIKMLLRQEPEWSLTFCYRDANRAAHLLAKTACNIAEEHVWMEEYPPIVDVAVLADKLCNSCYCWMKFILVYYQIQKKVN